MKERLKWIEISREALSANIRWIRAQLGPGVRLMAVVKAAAYGHGAPAVARLAVANGAQRPNHNVT